VAAAEAALACTSMAELITLCMDNSLNSTDAAAALAVLA
jgi:hypothetical protein